MQEAKPDRSSLGELKKVLVLVGTKAQFVKMAPVLLAMDESDVPYTLVYTGQHSETFDEMEAAFGTRPPDISLFPDFEADTRRGLLRWAFRFWLAVLKPSFRRTRSKHDMFLVHGDTASTLFGALLGRLSSAEVAHIEAGLRSPKMLDPFPEELIRRLVSRLSTVHFCPDEWACSNLSRLSGPCVDTRGNTLFDSVQLALNRPEMRSARAANTSEAPFGIVSIHRNENLSNSTRFELLMATILLTADEISLQFVLHPATRKRLIRSGWLERLQDHPRIHLLGRMDYFRFVSLMSRAKFLLTDGGSNQEEAALLGIPCLLLRKYTERQDGLGVNVELSNLDPAKISDFVRRYSASNWELLSPEVALRSPSRIIADALRSRLGG